MRTRLLSVLEEYICEVVELCYGTFGKATPGSAVLQSQYSDSGSFYPMYYPTQSFY